MNRRPPQVNTNKNIKCNTKTKYFKKKTTKHDENLIVKRRVWLLSQNLNNKNKNG